MKILLISQSFMAPNIGYNKNNYGGTEAFCNNFCLAYHKKHKITLLGMKDSTCNLPEINLITCDQYSRAYIENETGKKGRCSNNGLIGLISKLDLNDFDLIIDNTCNKNIYLTIDKKLDQLKDKPKAYSIAHSRPSYAGRNVDESIINMAKCKHVKFISVTESSTDEWNKLARKFIGDRDLFSGYFGLRILDKSNKVYDFDYENPKGIIVARMDGIKNFGQFNQIADNTPNMEFKAWTLLLPCGQRAYDDLKMDKHNIHGNLEYLFNQDICVKEAWIVTECPMTFSTSISENGGTTCIESMMYGLPICVVGHKENGCQKYVLDGKKIKFSENYVITEHGIWLAQNGRAHINFSDALKSAIELKAFNSTSIRKYFEENFCFNEAALNLLMNSL